MRETLGKTRNEKGITLIALVITIIVLLILAGISIAMLTGNNSILNQSVKAEEDTERGQTRDRIRLAVSVATIDGLGKIKYENLISQLNKEFGEGNYDIEPKNADAVEWTITAWKTTSRRVSEKVSIYEVPQVKDSTPGEFEGDGTEANPYKLMSIEDLVALSKMCNGREVFGKGSATPENFQGKYFELDTDLDFTSSKSYVDATRTDMGDINKNGKIEELKTELTSRTGFEAIGSGYDNDAECWLYFSGNFDGKDHTIYNLYQNANIGPLGFIGIYELSESSFGIRDLHLENVSITNTYDDWEGRAYVGAVVGEVSLKGNNGVTEVATAMVGCSSSGTIIPAIHIAGRWNRPV